MDRNCFLTSLPDPEVGCKETDVNNIKTKVCQCDTNLCNSADVIRGSATVTMVTAAIFSWLYSNYF